MRAALDVGATNAVARERVSASLSKHKIQSMALVCDLRDDAVETASRHRIRYGHGKWPDGPWETLFQETLVPVCAPSYVEANGPVKSVADLASRRLIHVAVTDPDWLGWEKYFELIGHDRAANSGGLRFGNYVQAVQTALAGEGIMLVWRSVVGDLLASEQLIIATEASVDLDHGYFNNRTSTFNAKNKKENVLDWLARQAGATAKFTTYATASIIRQSLQKRLKIRDVLFGQF